MWIGTENQGLCLLVEDKVTVLLAEDGLSHREVKVMWHDPDGSLWMGTREGITIMTKKRSKIINFNVKVNMLILPNML